jgi:hypothetical protein
MAKRKISSLDAVRDQINAAIRAYFLWDDLVSALTLAGAAERVLSDKQPADGILGVDAFSIRSMVNLYIEDEYQSKAAKLFRADYDFFRHADQKPQDDYEFSVRIPMKPAGYSDLKAATHSDLKAATVPI